MAKKGEAGRALGAATLASYIGGLVSVLCLWLISPQLAKLALQFSSAEFFLLAVFGLCIIGNISGEDIEKGLICGCLGILVATIGIDSVTSYIRFSPEGNFNFMGGINYIPIMIGLFAMSQAFENIETIFTKEEIEVKLTNILPKKEDLKKIFRIAPRHGANRHIHRDHTWCGSRHRFIRRLQHRAQHSERAGALRQRLDRSRLRPPRAETTASPAEP